MDEQRKYAIPFCRNNPGSAETQQDRRQACPARECAISDAISNAELILKRIDERWPADTVTELRK